MTSETESQTPKTLKMVESEIKSTKILECSTVANFSQNVRLIIRA